MELGNDILEKASRCLYDTVDKTDINDDSDMISTFTEFNKGDEVSNHMEYTDAEKFHISVLDNTNNDTQSNMGEIGNKANLKSQMYLCHCNIFREAHNALNYYNIYKDDKCNQNFSSKFDQSEMVYICECCKENFKYKVHIIWHIKSQYTEKLLECKSCSEKFESEETLFDHNKIHDSTNNLICQYCTQSFSTSSHLLVHTKTHMVEKKFQCNACAKVYSQKSDLIYHIRTHMNIKPFVCKVCDKLFTYKHRFVEHLEMHANNKQRYFCPYCQKIVHKKCDLRSHIATHNKLGSDKGKESEFVTKTDIKNESITDLSVNGNNESINDYVDDECKSENSFTCEVCLKSFPSKDDLKKHFDEHTNIKPYGCQYCGKTFSRSSDLIKHTELHIRKINLLKSISLCVDDKQYTCRICTKSFKFEQHLVTHEKTHSLNKHSSDYIDGGKIVSEVAQLETVPEELLQPHEFIIEEEYVELDHNSLQLDPLFSEDSDVNCLLIVTNKKTENEEQDNQFFRCNECLVLFPSKLERAKHAKSHKLFVCPFCNRKLSSKERLDGHITTHTSDKSIVCKICNKIFAHKSYLNTHMKLHADEKCHVCNHCGKTFCTNSNLNKHLIIHSDKKRFVCEMCDKSFNAKFHLIAHIRKHLNEKPFACKVCTKAFTLKQHLVDHIRTHTNERPFSCQYCSKTFKDSSTRNLHTKIHTKTNIFLCEICDREFIQKNSLMRHFWIHATEKPFCSDPNSHDIPVSDSDKQPNDKLFTCLICNSSFTKKHYLVNHVTVHTNEKPFCCEHCGKKFHEIYKLNKHLELHASGKQLGSFFQRVEPLNREEKEFKCRVCNEIFSQKSELDSHISVHINQSSFLYQLYGGSFDLKQNDGEQDTIGEKSYKCEYCDKSYRLSSTRNKHIKLMHSTENFPSCEYCHRKFYCNSSLRNHIRIHTNERVFKCELCVKTFIQKGALDKHVITHGSDDAPHCDYCKKKFNTISSVYKHINKMHSNSESFKCDVCGDRFRLQKSLDRHSKIHSQERPFSCDLCNKSFRTKKYLTRHTKCHTNGKPPPQEPPPLPPPTLIELSQTACDPSTEQTIFYDNTFNTFRYEDNMVIQTDQF